MERKRGKNPRRNGGPRRGEPRRGEPRRGEPRRGGPRRTQDNTRSYYCLTCDKRWIGSNQECWRCHNIAETDHRQHSEESYVEEPKPHLQELCGKCKALGKCCVMIEGDIISMRRYLSKEEWKKGISYKKITAGEDDKMFGSYHCTNCNYKWASANCWGIYDQQCKKCHKIIKPDLRTPLLKKRDKTRAQDEYWEERLDKQLDKHFDEYFTRYYSQDKSEYYDEYYDNFASQYFIRNYDTVTKQYYNEYYDEKYNQYFIRTYDKVTEGYYDEYYDEQSNRYFTRNHD